MALAPRAAAIRGDDYQHAIGWYWTCRALDEPDISSISIEDAGGGQFDDIVIRRGTGVHTYWQAKSSNSGNVVIDEEWLTSAATPAGRSPLQHFHTTWRDLRTGRDPLDLGIVTNRGYQASDPILGTLRDLKTEKISTADLAAASPRSKIGKARKRWCLHLAIDMDELVAFLDDVRWIAGGSEASWDRQAKNLMRLAGLRSDEQAVSVGKQMIRSWVTDGAGPQTRDDIRRQVAQKNLLARSGTLLFAVHAIDKRTSNLVPTVEVDFVDLYVGDDSFTRLRLRDQDDWSAVVKPKLRAAARDLDAYATRRVHVIGYMRLPVWFAVGRELPDVRGWVLSLDQQAHEWRTDVPVDDVKPALRASIAVNAGADLAVAIALTHDIAADVEQYVIDAQLNASKLLVLGPASDTEPGLQSVPGPGWAMGWARAAREIIRKHAETTGAQRIHLFQAAPAGVALFLGHGWNLMPPTTLYDHLHPGYAPSLELA